MSSAAAGKGEPAAPPESSRDSTVAVVDGLMDGHHTTYLCLVSKMLLDLGARVLVLCPEPEEVIAWLEEHTAHDLSDRVATAPFRLPRPRHPPRHRLAGLLRYLDRWRVTARAIRRLCRGSGDGFAGPPRLVMFLWLDDFLSSARYISVLSPLFLPLVFRHPWAGLFFRPVHLRGLKDEADRPRRHPYSALRSPSCRRVFIHDESKLVALGQGHAEGRQAKHHARARFFPDFTDESAPDDDFVLIEELRARARGRKIACALGSMSKRKGILTLLEVAEAAEVADESCGDEPWFFLFAGELVEHHFSAQELGRLRELSDRPPDNCCCYFRRIPGEPSFNALIAASDVVFAAYRNFRHSSNILTKAALFNKPVIVSRGYLMEERVRQFNLGVAVAQDSAEECAGALRLLYDPRRFGEPKFDDYMQRHSLASFRAELAELLREP